LGVWETVGGVAILVQSCAASRKQAMADFKRAWAPDSFSARHTLEISCISAGLHVAPQVPAIERHNNGGLILSKAFSHFEIPANILLMTKLDKSRGQQSGGSRSAGRVRRFPYLLSIGVTAEIMQGLEAGTHNGLFSISDSARLALVHGLMASGQFPPRLNNQPQLQNGGNGHGPVGSSFSHHCGSRRSTSHKHNPR
jgi:hypothetical protein